MKTLKNAEKYTLKFDRYSVKMANIGFINKYIINSGMRRGASALRPQTPCLRRLGAPPPALESFAFLCNNKLILELF